MDVESVLQEFDKRLSLLEGKRCEVGFAGFDPKPTIEQELESGLIEGSMNDGYWRDTGDGKYACCTRIFLPMAKYGKWCDEG